MIERYEGRVSIRYTIEDLDGESKCHRSDGPSLIYLDGTLLFYENGKYSGAIESDGRIYLFRSITKISFSRDRWGRKEW